MGGIFEFTQATLDFADRANVKQQVSELTWISQNFSDRSNSYNEGR
jgi:hypothetical protein